MVQGEDSKWRTMANEKLYAAKMALGAIYRSELAQGLAKFGYGIEKTHADGRFEIAGVPRRVIEAFSTRRAEIEAAMEARDLGTPAENPRLAERATLMTRAHKRDVDRVALEASWEKQAAALGFDAKALVAEAHPGPGRAREAGKDPAEGKSPERGVGSGEPVEMQGNAAAEAVAWAMAHLSEREAVFARTDLLACRALHWRTGETVDDRRNRARGRGAREGREPASPSACPAPKIRSATDRDGSRGARDHRAHAGRPGPGRRRRHAKLAW